VHVWTEPTRSTDLTPSVCHPGAITAPARRTMSITHSPVAGKLVGASLMASVTANPD
jgi:hypothetical protein